MDLLNGFELDPEDDERHEIPRSSFDTVPVTDRPHLEPSVKKIPDEVFQHAERQVGHPVSPDEQFVDSFDDLDDTDFNEVMQHAQQTFPLQCPAQKQRRSSSQYVDDAVLNKNIETAERLDHQSPLHEEYVDQSKCVDKSVPGKVITHTGGCLDHQTSYNEQYMDSLDDNAFEEATDIEEDLRLPQLSERLSVSSQKDPVFQQVRQNVRRDISHQASAHEAKRRTPTEQVIKPVAQYSYYLSHPWDPADEPRKAFPGDSALNEALQYAYKNELTTDYLRKTFSITHLFSPLVQSTIPTTTDFGFTDHSHLPAAEIPNPVVLDKSKTLTITPRALKLIAEARFVQSDETIESLTKEVCTHDESKPKRLELPILRTDNDRDVKAFRDHSLSCPDALLKSIKRHRLPFYPQNTAEGEGMELSSEVRAKSKMMMKCSEEEKLSVTRDTLTYLVNHLKDDYTTEDQMKYLVDAITYKEIPKFETVTPPLSPKLTPKQIVAVFDPSLLPIPSDDSESLLSDNFRAIEDMMLGEHQDVWGADTSPIRESLEETWSIPDQYAFWQRPRQFVEDMKVEVPLMLTQPPLKPRTSGLEAFQGFVEAEIDLDPEFERAVLHDLSDDGLEGQLQERLHAAAETAVQIVEQEQLQAIDAVGRVPIPLMNFLIPEPEWTRLCGSENSGISILKWIQAGKEQLFNPPSWPLDKMAASKMIWSPLAPGSGNTPEIEGIHVGEPHLRKYLEETCDEKVPTSLNHVKYREAPTIFEFDDADEDIETQLSREKPAVDLMNVVRKRSMNTNAESTPKRSRHNISLTPLHQNVRNSGPSLIPGDSPNASGNLLANFMEIHAPKKREWIHSKYFASAQTDVPQSPALTPPTAKQNSTQTVGQPKACVRAPCPAIEPPGTALTVFISISIPRRMIRVLESLVPSLTLLERNYDAHNTFSWSPGSVARTEVIPPLGNDADITLSPTTGLILTSMIRVRQKPRTGTSKSAVQIRLEKACPRYERLIVLIGGEGGKDDSIDAMSVSDSTSLLELCGFASGLECIVQVYCIGGGDQTLAIWVATCICRYGLVDSHILSGLLEPETLWEVFLRRAGFNVFAAQAVASQFKPPSDESNVAQSIEHGLTTFMTMTRDERMRHFSQLVGPRVLERVSRNIDELWNHR